MLRRRRRKNRKKKRKSAGRGKEKRLAIAGLPVSIKNVKAAKAALTFIRDGMLTPKTQRNDN